ncbi:hypothetical protein INT43_000467 [Umbelopsis isabellina]|uniref:Glutathione S-transferase C-terminal domain-containing protein n=1 Tax=Mortierella isabellina TaxID=91625 RepID=A0A8H7Q3C5_MORIS|nr:hypothetical protein INT43_000467 [Umbelopsis isabellina]
MALIDQFCFSWEELHEKYWPLLYGWKKLLTTEQFNETLHKVLHEQIKPIVMKHEETPAKNGSDFYVGDKMTLADIHATISVPFLNYDHLFTKEAVPKIYLLCTKSSWTMKPFEKSFTVIHQSKRMIIEQILGTGILADFRLG